MIDDIAQIVIEEIKRQATKKSTLLIAIDGRCAAGKTSLAANINELCDCNVIHMDHFFLRPEQRTAERLQQAGGNVDYERFLAEVLIPLYEGRIFSYCPFNCHKLEMGEPILIPQKSLNIVEGSYSCHPALRSYYDMTIFLNVNAEEQIRRIRFRNGVGDAVKFEKQWIPMEEHYFNAFLIRKQCDLFFQT